MLPVGLSSVRWLLDGPAPSHNFNDAIHSVTRIRPTDGREGAVAVAVAVAVVVAVAVDITACVAFALMLVMLMVII